MADSDEIQAKVKRIIIDELGVDEQEVTPNARFIDDLGADSLDTVELVMRFEEEFGIEIPDEDAEKIQSVRDAYNYIDQHKGKWDVGAGLVPARDYLYLARGQGQALPPHFHRWRFR